MASKDKIKVVIATIKTLYPYYAKDVSVEALFLTWGKLLGRYNDDMVEAALIMALENCSNPPAPADIIRYIKELERASEPSNEELWEILNKALRKTSAQVFKLRYPEYGVDHRAKITEIWEELPVAVKKYLGGEGELMRLSGISNEELSYEKARFFKVLPDINSRIEITEHPSLGATTNGKEAICDTSTVNPQLHS